MERCQLLLVEQSSCYREVSGHFESLERRQPLKHPYLQCAYKHNYSKNAKLS